MKTIALDVGGTKIKAGIVERDKVSSIVVEKTKSDGDLEDVLTQLTDIIRKLIDNKVKAIALGLPSRIDPEKGEVISTTNIPSLHEFNIVGYLEELFGIPVFIQNDTACFALGELYFGKAKEKKRAIAVTLGTGMGVAAVNNGQIINLYGREDAEFGERKFLNKTFEDYCSGKYFTDTFGTDSLDMQKRAEEGDKKALKSFKNLGRHLSEALKILIFEHNPEIIILGGSISNSYFLFSSEFKDLGVKVSPSKLENAALLGASKLSNKNE